MGDNRYDTVRYLGGAGFDKRRTKKVADNLPGVGAEEEGKKCLLGVSFHDRLNSTGGDSAQMGEVGECVVLLWEGVDVPVAADVPMSSRLLGYDLSKSSCKNLTL